LAATWHIFFLTKRLETKEKKEKKKKMGGVALILPACLESIAKTVGCDKQDIDNCITCFVALEKNKNLANEEGARRSKGPPRSPR
jgi:hypothetical protein